MYKRICLFGLLAVILLSCRNDVVNINFRAHYYMNLDSIKIQFEDQYENILLDTLFDSDEYINIRLYLKLDLPSSHLRVRVNSVDTLVDLNDYRGCQSLYVEFRNMFDDGQSPIVFGNQFERLIIKPICR